MSSKFAFMKLLDVFPYELKLYYKNDTVYKSYAGAMFSLGFFAAIIYFFYVFSGDMFARKNPQIFSKESKIPNYFNVNLTKFTENIQISGSIISKEAVNVNEIFQPHFSFGGKGIYTIEKINLNAQNNSQNLTKIDSLEITINAVNVTQKASNFVYDPANYNNYFNASQKNTNTSNSSASNPYSYQASYKYRTIFNMSYQFTFFNDYIISIFQNDFLPTFSGKFFYINSNDYMFENVTFNSRFFDSIIDMDDKENKFSSNIDLTNVIYDNNLNRYSAYYNIRYHLFEINDNNHIILSNNIKFNDFSIDQYFAQKNYIDENSQSSELLLNHFEIEFSKKMTIYKRIYKKIQNVFADIGGLISCMFIAGQVMVGLFNKQVFDLEIVNKLFSKYEAGELDIKLDQQNIKVIPYVHDEIKPYYFSDNKTDITKDATFEALDQITRENTNTVKIKESLSAKNITNKVIHLEKSKSEQNFIHNNKNAKQYVKADSQVNEEDSEIINNDKYIIEKNKKNKTNKNNSSSINNIKYSIRKNSNTKSKDKKRSDRNRDQSKEKATRNREVDKVESERHNPSIQNRNARDKQRRNRKHYDESHDGIDFDEGKINQKSRKDQQLSEDYTDDNYILQTNKSSKGLLFTENDHFDLREKQDHQENKDLSEEGNLDKFNVNFKDFQTSNNEEENTYTRINRSKSPVSTNSELYPNQYRHQKNDNNEFEGNDISGFDNNNSNINMMKKRKHSEDIEDIDFGNIKDLKENKNNKKNIQNSKPGNLKDNKNKIQNYKVVNLNKLNEFDSNQSKEIISSEANSIANKSSKGNKKKKNFNSYKNNINNNKDIKSNYESSHTFSNTIPSDAESQSEPNNKNQIKKRKYGKDQKSKSQNKANEIEESQNSENYEDSENAVESSDQDSSNNEDSSYINEEFSSNKDDKEKDKEESEGEEFNPEKEKANEERKNIEKIKFEIAALDTNQILRDKIDKMITKKHEKENAEKVDKKRKFRFTNMELFKVWICPTGKCKSQKLIEKEKVYNHALTKVHDYFDVINLMKLYENFYKMQKILFNNNQIIAFGTLRDRYFDEIIKNEKQDLLSIVKYYKSIEKLKTCESADIKLYNLLDVEIKNLIHFDKEDPSIDQSYNNMNNNNKNITIKINNDTNKDTKLNTASSANNTKYDKNNQKRNITTSVNENKNNKNSTKKPTNNKNSNIKNTQYNSNNQENSNAVKIAKNRSQNRNKKKY